MIKHEVLELAEQKYAGIKTVIRFKDADQTDFAQLHKAVCEADIHDIDHREHFMAMDSDFTEESFSYTPLVPVTDFGQNGKYTCFSREKGTYCAFEVRARELNPDWFKRVFAYVKEKGISLENTGYDLEYYKENYLTMRNEQKNNPDRVLKILLKMKT